jgi:hypothetical protein
MAGGVIFMADKVALEHVSVAALNFSRCLFIVTPMLHIQLSIIQKADHGPEAGRNSIQSHPPKGEQKQTRITSIKY